jgi:tRNA modification GTPase
VIWVRDLTSRDVSEFERSALVALPKDVEIWVVWNKLDALGSVSREDLPVESLDSGRSLRNFYLSAVDGGGLASFIEALGSFLAGAPSQESVFSARQRHLVVLVEVLRLVESAVPLVGASGELAADQLRLAQEKLGEITGEFHSDDLLGAIFSSFCIGK